MSDSRKINFALVHGTFGANSDWLNLSAEQDQKGFRALLSSSSKKVVNFIVPTPWGGISVLGKLNDLTNRARLDGADNLAEELIQLPDHDANFLIAHSHGGNVAMYALQNQQAKQKIDGLICLATPFLYPRRRPLSLTTLILSLLIMIVGYFQFAWSFDLSNSSALTWCGAILLFVVAVLIPFALVILIAKQRFSADDALGEHIDNLSFKDPEIPVLLIRASGDEASGLLRAGQFLNWLAGMVMRIGGRQLYILVCAGLLLFAWSAYQDFTWVPDISFALLNSLLIGVAAIMVVMLMALTISRTFVGWDAWRWVGEIETMIEDGPPGMQSELTVLTPRLPEQGLSHTALFTQADTIEVIQQWCELQISNADE